jgi:SAM-dependent methyltransferase
MPCLPWRRGAFLVSQHPLADGMSYVCPLTKESLDRTPDGLRRADGILYAFIAAEGDPIADFVLGNVKLQAHKDTAAMYDSPHSGDIYRNFLDWLFASFDENEEAFRRRLISRLRLAPGQRVLVTGCGLGEDLIFIAEAIGAGGALYAQDLSRSMVLQANRNFARSCQILVPHFSIGDALDLPFADGFFDAVFHFGGINLFGDMPGAIREMARVAKPGGRVVFGDEGIAPWLRDTEYAKVAITNNPLWASRIPLDRLPMGCNDVNCTWVLGNCFYVIDFAVAPGGPKMNIDIPHKGRRGGTARTRFYGQLEGVTPESRQLVVEAAGREGISMHEWLERAIQRAATRSGGS